MTNFSPRWLTGPIETYDVRQLDVPQDRAALAAETDNLFAGGGAAPPYRKMRLRGQSQSGEVPELCQEGKTMQLKKTRSYEDHGVLLTGCGAEPFSARSGRQILRRT